MASTEEYIYKAAYWLTYGVLPPTYKPLESAEIQKILEQIVTPKA